MRSPLEITDEQYWLRSRDVSDSALIGGDQYFETHGVTPSEAVTADDLPQTDSEPVRELDRAALDRGKTIGKWQATGPGEYTAALWPDLVEDAAAGTIWAVKAMTAFGYEQLSMYDEYVLTVYTPNYFETEDVWRVRDHLRAEHGVTGELYYKPDVYTAEGIDADTAEAFGLEAPARYVG